MAALATVLRLSTPRITLSQGLLIPAASPSYSSCQSNYLECQGKHPILTLLQCPHKHRGGLCGRGASDTPHAPGEKRERQAGKQRQCVRAERFRVNSARRGARFCAVQRGSKPQHESCASHVNLACCFCTAAWQPAREAPNPHARGRGREREFVALHHSPGESKKERTNVRVGLESGGPDRPPRPGETEREGERERERKGKTYK